jgi:hypothetical protein
MSIVFGYVIPLKGELKVKEYEVFKSYYCGLCSAIGEKSGISRLTLTYDMTFLGLLLSSVYAERDFTRKKICCFKMKPVVAIGINEYMEYAADMNIILANRKLIDDYKDDKNYFSFLLSKLIKTKRLVRLSQDKSSKIDENLERLNQAEKAGCGIDEASHHFAELTSEIFDVGSSGRIMKVMGYNLGKWIYTIDAYDDIEENIEKGRYNPWVASYKHDREEARDFKERIRGNVEFTLLRCLDELTKAFELLDVKKNRGLLENIMYLGLERTTMKKFEGGCNHDKSLRGFRFKGRCFPGGDKAGI